MPRLKVYDSGTTQWVYVNSGGGSVTGPVSSTDNNVALFNGTTGKLIKDSGKAITTLIARTVTVTSGSFTAGSTAATDYIYLHAGAHNATLPTASGNSNRYAFKNNHTANVTVTRAGSDTVEGSTSISIAPGASVDLISNGSTAWYII